MFSSDVSFGRAVGLSFAKTSPVVKLLMRMQLTELFGPQFKVIGAMAVDLVRFYILWFIILTMLTSLARLSRLHLRLLGEDALVIRPVCLPLQHALTAKLIDQVALVIHLHKLFDDSESFSHPVCFSLHIFECEPSGDDFIQGQSQQVLTLDVSLLMVRGARKVGRSFALRKHRCIAPLAAHASALSVTGQRPFLAHCFANYVRRLGPFSLPHLLKPPALNGPALVAPLAMTARCGRSGVLSSLLASCALARFSFLPSGSESSLLDFPRPGFSAETTNRRPIALASSGLGAAASPLFCSATALLRRRVLNGPALLPRYLAILPSPTNAVREFGLCVPRRQCTSI